MKNTTNSKPPRQPKPKPICFSFSAYANTLINALKSSNLAVSQGLSDTEFTSLQSTFNFTFPPDLRQILQQGLPISPGFPNWRSSSPQQLHLLLNLPALSILRRLSKAHFWHPSWGPKPNDPAQSFETVRRILTDAPRLVPIYQHCYIPSTPDVAGNPVFYVDHDGHVSVVSFDVIGFFREAEFVEEAVEREPAWAATRARRIEFWSEVAAVEDGGGGWWWGEMKGELGGCLEGVLRRLREGGWRENEIREMMMVMDGHDELEEKKEKSERCLWKDKEGGMVWHVRVLSLMLLRAGWSREDVVYSLGVIGGGGDDDDDDDDDEGMSWLEFYHHQQQQQQQQPTPTTLTVNINGVM
ncbi:hypothetical protein RIF29_36919 [Crotalaria pallida]|uniref:Knr4/Smi1-like domain-containing protein n=1 Tax=Crotalaria pallida TaxID=3830 RepID=A0AAN9HW14_CROPI